MYDKFCWTRDSARRNRLTAEYEPLQPFLLLALAEQAACTTFFDVGANIGVYSLFATLVPSIEQIIAFEADPYTVIELQENLRLNGVGDRVKVEPKALSDAAKTVTFGVVGRLSGANSIVGTSIHAQSAFRQEVTVDAISLDTYLRHELPQPFCFKIDVEGHEAAVIKGGKETLAEHKGIIQIECYGQAGEANARSLSELGYSRLTAVGPDHYFSNIESLSGSAALIAAYEQASRALIAYNHARTTPALEYGDFRLEVSGKSGDMLRSLKKRVRLRRK